MTDRQPEAGAVPVPEPGDIADLWVWCRRMRDRCRLPPGWMPPTAANDE